MYAVVARRGFLRQAAVSDGEGHHRVIVKAVRGAVCDRPRSWVVLALVEREFQRLRLVIQERQRLRLEEAGEEE